MICDHKKYIYDNYRVILLQNKKEQQIYIDFGNKTPIY